MKVNRSCIKPRLEWLSVSEGKSSLSILAHGNKLVVEVKYDGHEILSEWVSFEVLTLALLTIPKQP